MHYHVEVYIPKEELDAVIESAPVHDVSEYEAGVLAARHILSPYYIEASQDGFYDWYQIGGRWTGSHVPSYDPEQDSRNRELCDMCFGTGVRMDEIAKRHRLEEPDYTCNGCGSKDGNGKWVYRNGKGIQVKWPTKWAPFDGDVMHVSKIPYSLSCEKLVINGSVVGPLKAVKPYLDNIDAKDGYLVTVDCHF